MKNDFGFLKQDNFLSKKQINTSNNVFENVFEKKKFAEVQTNIRALNAKNIKNEPFLFSLCQDLKKEFQSIVKVSDLTFDKLWFVRSEAQDTDKTKLPYIPHFDKRRYLKVMIYLHDVSIEHGPIHFGIFKDSIDAEERRINLPVDYKELGLNTANNKELKQKLTPIIGNAGDAVFFDTNTPHGAGIIKSGYTRKVLRFDFERPFFNQKPSFLNRISSKIAKITTG